MDGLPRIYFQVRLPEGRSGKEFYETHLELIGEPGTWTESQTETYETAWRAWRDLARDLQAAVTEHAEAEGQAERGGGQREEAGATPS